MNFPSESEKPKIYTGKEVLKIGLEVTTETNSDAKFIKVVYLTCCTGDPNSIKYCHKIQGG